MEWHVFLKPDFVLITWQRYHNFLVTIQVTSRENDYRLFLESCRCSLWKEKFQISPKNTRLLLITQRLSRFRWTAAKAIRLTFINNLTTFYLEAQHAPGYFRNFPNSWEGEMSEISDLVDACISSTID